MVLVNNADVVCVRASVVKEAQCFFAMSRSEEIDEQNQAALCNLHKQGHIELRRTGGFSDWTITILKTGRVGDGGGALTPKAKPRNAKRSRSFSEPREARSRLDMSTTQLEGLLPGVLKGNSGNAMQSMQGDHDSAQAGLILV